MFDRERRVGAERVEVSAILPFDEQYDRLTRRIPGYAMNLADSDLRLFEKRFDQVRGRIVTDAARHFDTYILLRESDSHVRGASADHNRD